jgi:hypothetical protein
MVRLVLVLLAALVVAARAARGRPVTVTGSGFVGTKRLTVTLNRGQWSYFAPGRASVSFLVGS